MAGGFDEHPENINRDGAPKKEWTFAGVFREELEKCGDDKVKLKRRLAKAMMKKAKEGDVQAFKEIANRVDGLPTQFIEGNLNLYKLKIIRDGKDDKAT